MASQNGDERSTQNEPSRVNRQPLSVKEIIKALKTHEKEDLLVTICVPGYPPAMVTGVYKVNGRIQIQNYPLGPALSTKPAPKEEVKK